MTVWILFMLAKESHLWSVDTHTSVAVYATERACEQALDHEYVSYEQNGMSVKRSLCIKNKVRKER